MSEDVVKVKNRYVWVCPVCGRAVSSYTRAMTLKYARLHMRKHVAEQGGEK
jgi:hypothetical protein